MTRSRKAWPRLRRYRSIFIGAESRGKRDFGDLADAFSAKILLGQSPLQMHRVFFGCVWLKSAAQIIRHCGRIIKRAGVQPDAFGAVGPGLFNGGGQQMFSESASDKFRQQTEVSNFSRAI